MDNTPASKLVRNVFFHLQNLNEILETHTYTEVVEMTGISKSTLIRARKNKRLYNLGCW